MTVLQNPFRLSAACLQRWGGRAFWAAMLVMHVRATLAALGFSGDGGFQMLRAVGLLACVTLFTLKILDVHWLRLPPDRRIWLAVAIGVALLHAGVVTPDAFVSPVEALTWQTLLLVTAAATAVDLVSRVMRRFTLRALRGRLHEHLLRISHVARHALLPPRDLRLAAVHSIVRPPPMR